MAGRDGQTGKGRKRPPRILFIHENFPAQFGTFAGWLAARGWDVTFATAREGVGEVGFRVVTFKPHREVTKGIHHYVAGFERAVINGQAFVREAVRLRAAGYVPDIVVAHSGWGVGTFVKDVWPETRFVPYFEWFYHWPPRDRSRHDPPSDDLEGRARARVRNAPMWLDLSSADGAICPTGFQAEQFPQAFRDRITVLPDGFDTAMHCPGPRDDALLARFGVPRGAPVLTYLARGMEPSRGFPEMMEAVALLQKRRADLHAVIVGEDRVAYGRKLDSGSWRTSMLERLALDQSRLHFTGRVSRPDMIRIFQSSDAHLYLSVPFVLSWSAIEAMSCGCLMVASDVAPVREVMRHEENALLVDMHDAGAIADAVERALAKGDDIAAMRQRARADIVARFDAESVAFPRTVAYFESLFR